MRPVSVPADPAAAAAGARAAPAAAPCVSAWRCSLRVRQQRCGRGRGCQRADMAVAELHELGLDPRKQRLVTLEQRAACTELEPEQRRARRIADQAAPLIGPRGQAFERFALEKQALFTEFAPHAVFASRCPPVRRCALAGRSLMIRDRFTRELRQTNAQPQPVFIRLSGNCKRTPVRPPRHL